MYYLFEIAYKYELDTILDGSRRPYYEIAQIIGKDPKDASDLIRCEHRTGRGILESKIIKITPINSVFCANETIIREQYYNKFEAIDEGVKCE